jgi:hypothetical protein
LVRADGGSVGGFINTKLLAAPYTVKTVWNF